MQSNITNVINYLINIDTHYVIYVYKKKEIRFYFVYNDTSIENERERQREIKKFVYDNDALYFFFVFLLFPI